MERLNHRRWCCYLNSWASETTTRVSIVQIHKPYFLSLVLLCSFLFLFFLLHVATTLNVSLLFALSLFSASHNTHSLSHTTIVVLHLRSHSHNASQIHNSHWLTCRSSSNKQNLTHTYICVFFHSADFHFAESRFGFSADFDFPTASPPSGGINLHNKLPLHSCMGGVNQTSLSLARNEFLHR